MAGNTISALHKYYEQCLVNCLLSKDKMLTFTISLFRNEETDVFWCREHWGCAGSGPPLPMLSCLQCGVEGPGRSEGLASSVMLSCFSPYHVITGKSPGITMLLRGSGCLIGVRVQHLACVPSTAPGCSCCAPCSFPAPAVDCRLIFWVMLKAVWLLSEFFTLVLVVEHKVRVWLSSGQKGELVDFNGL